MRFTRFFAGIVAVILGMGTGAWADRVVTITPRLTVSEGYTDNVDTVPSGEKEEWTTVVSPGIDLSVLSKTSGFTLSYTPGFTFTAKNRADSEIRHALSADYWKQVTKNLRITVGEVFTRTEEPYTIRAPVFERVEEGVPVREDTTIRRRREPYNESTTHAALRYQFGPRDFVSFSYTFGFLVNEDPDVEDNRRHHPTVSVTWWPWEHYGLQAAVSYERGDFSGDTDYTNNYQAQLRFLKEFSRHLTGYVGYMQTIFDSVGDKDDYLIYEGFVGVDYLPEKDYFVSLGVGYFYRDAEEEGNDGGLKLIGDVGKTWRFRRGSVRISGGTGYEQTYFGAENLGFTVFYRADAAGSYALTKRLNGTAHLSFVRNEYRDEDPQRNDNITTFSAALHYQVLQWLFLHCGYSYRTVDSNDENEDYEENRVTVSLSLVPTRGFRFK